VVRSGRGADRRSDPCTHYKTDHSMLGALGPGGLGHPRDVFAFYRDIGAVFFQSERFISNRNEVPSMELHAQFDYFDALASLQAVKIGP